MIKVLFLVCFLLCVFAVVLLALCPLTGQEPSTYVLAAVDALVFALYVKALSRCVR